MTGTVLLISSGEQSLVVVNTLLTAHIAKCVADAFTPDFDDRLLLHRALRSVMGEERCFASYCVDMSTSDYLITFLSESFAGKSPCILRYGKAPAQFVGKSAASFRLTLSEAPRTTPGRLSPSSTHNYYLSK